MADLQTRLSALITGIGADIKRMNQRVGAGSTTTPFPVGSSVNNSFYLSAQAATAAFGAPTGTPVDGNHLFVHIKDNGTARAITWDAIYRTLDSTNAVLPSTTVVSKWTKLSFMYNATDAKWDLLSVVQQA